jgi:hypothetical protein
MHIAICNSALMAIRGMAASEIKEIGDLFFAIE